MSTAMKRAASTIFFLLSMAMPWGGIAAADTGAPADLTSSQLSGQDILIAEPVDAVQSAPAANSATPVQIPGDGLAPSPATEERAPVDFARPHVLLPYYLTAYIPPIDHTELNLGIFISQSPGIDVALGWGAAEQLMLSAKMSALGASSTVGLGLKYLLLPETVDSTKPAIAFLAQGLFLNHRTLGEVRENIFRGGRAQIGIALSKNLGLLTGNLQAGRALQELLSNVYLHAEALLEYQAGRSGINEESVSQIALGAKAALEATIQPKVIYGYLVVDSLPDWLGRENYYVGIRYYSQPDLAFDLLGGQIQKDLGLLLAISWIF